MAAVAPPSGMIAWWSGDGHAGDYAGDHHGILEGGATFAAGQVGQAFSLDGIDDRVRIPHDAALNPSDGFTVEAWIKSDSTAGARVIVSKWSDATGDWSYIFKDHNSSDKLRIELSAESHNDLADLAGLTSIRTGRWTHVAATYDTTSVRLYFNGVLDGTRAVTPTERIDESLTDLLIGAVTDGTSENFDGLIDEVSLYNRALSGAEIQSISQAGASGKLKPMTVMGSSPATGGIVHDLPTEFLVDFSFPPTAGSLQAADLTVDGQPASGVSLLDSNTARFTFAASPVTSQGPQVMQIAAGAIQSSATGLASPNIQAWSDTFYYDLTRMEVAGTSPAPGGQLKIEGVTATLKIDFNEPALATSVDPTDLRLSQGIVTRAELIDADTAEYDIADLGEGLILIDLPAGEVTDTFGNPIVAYHAEYTADVGTVAFGTLIEQLPTGYGIFQGSKSGNFSVQFPSFVAAGSGGLNGPTGIIAGPDGNIYVSSQFDNSVLRYDGTTGEFIDAFVAPGSGGLAGPIYLVFGPTGDLYVSSRDTSSVLRYDGVTGAFKGTFASGNGLDFVEGLTFGPDGNLYVVSRFGNSVLRFNGTTGSFLGPFVPAESGGLLDPVGLVFGTDGNLYVSSRGTDSILKYDGASGAPLGTFASGGGLIDPHGLTFGSDGHLYVSGEESDNILIFDGTTGAPLGPYVPTIIHPVGLTFVGSALFVSAFESHRVYRFDQSEMGPAIGPGDVDAFTLDVSANETLALRVLSGLETNLSLVHSVLGTVPLPADQDAGPGRLYQILQLPQDGTLTISVQAPNGMSEGDYALEVTLGALLDQSTASNPQTQSLNQALRVVDAAEGIQQTGVLGAIERNVPRITTETEGILNDLRGSWDRIASSTTWRLNSGSGVAGSLNRKGTGNDASDSWRFEARAGDVISVRTRGSSSGGTLPKANVTLRMPDGSTVVGATVPQTTSDFQIQNLSLTQSGLYTIIVNTPTNNKGTYSLFAEITTAGDPRFPGDDYYSLQIEQAGLLALSLATGSNVVSQPRVQLTLLDSTGQVIATSNPQGTLDAYLSVNVIPGDYRIRVSATTNLTSSTAAYGMVAELDSASAPATAEEIDAALTLLLMEETTPKRR